MTAATVDRATVAAPEPVTGHAEDAYHVPSRTRGETGARAAATPPDVSVVIATYNRTDAVARLLGELAAQTLPPERFEVVVVDDGSAEPVAARLATVTVPYALTLVRQSNAGPAAARDAAVRRASAPLVVVLDDDMRVGPGFVAAHLAAHPAGSRRLVLGRLRADSTVRLPLFERFQLAKLDRLAQDVQAGARQVRGGDVYTGNVSFRRDDYLAVGGFDPALRLSEDAEFGMRLERAGVELTLSEAAWSLHASDHASAAAWMRRARAYGAADARVAAKQLAPVATLPPADPARAAVVRASDPWRFLFAVHPVSRPALLACALAPSVSGPIAHTAMFAARLAGAARLEGLALAGTTFVYGVRYFAGVRDAAGSRRAALGALRRHLNAADARQLGPVARVAKCAADLHADHDALVAADAKYRPSTGPRAGADAGRRPSMLLDAVRRVGFQMLVAYRLMRLLRDLRLTPLAMVASRLIRHLYGADLHWDADLAPGVIVVHGVGLVVSPAARVGPGCVLFQHVTLGESMHPTRRTVGGPTLEANVHVGPGATVLGPVTVGRGTKVMAAAVVMDDVPADSIVETPAPVVRPRRAGAPAPEAA